MPAVTTTRSLKCVALFILSLALTPATASADGLLTGFLGSPVGADAEESALTYGGSLGFMGGGVFGLEFDFGVTPDFFDGGTDDVGVADTQVVTLMGNLILGVPIGGVRPYGSAGLGLLRTRLESARELFDEVSSNDFGFNIGGGVMGFFSSHVGVRGDLRYFRSFEDLELGGFDFETGDFDFWRGTAGVVLRF